MTDLNKLRKSMEKAVKSFNELKSVGINQDILITYLSAKTGMSKRIIKEVLKNQEKFYNDLIDKEMLKEL